MPATNPRALPIQPAPLAPSAEFAGEVGGAVGALQQQLRDRLMAGEATLEWATAPTMPLDERAVQAVSRAAGPILLLAGFAWVALRLF